MLYTRAMSQPKGRWSPAVLNTTHDGKQGYATSDLFVPHPTKPGSWMVHGRADDQIVFSNGEKVSFKVRSARCDPDHTSFRPIQFLSVCFVPYFVYSLLTNSFTERILAQDSRIQTAVMFGSGKSQCGVIIQPSASSGVDIQSASEIEQFKDAIWCALSVLACRVVDADCSLCRTGPRSNARTPLHPVMLGSSER